MGLTPTAVFTQHPESLSVTNSWSFVGDPDIDGVAVSSSDPEEFTISARQDGKVSMHGNTSEATQSSPLCPSSRHFCSVALHCILLSV